MKKQIIPFAILTVLLMASCKDFLDIEPTSQSIAVENTDADSLYFKSASEVEAALAGAYSDFKNEYWELDYFVNGDAQSDDAYAGGDNPDNFQIDEFQIVSTNRNVSRDWAYLYSTIGKCNTVINNVGDVTDPELIDTRKEEIIGEASFIRAYMYFQLVQLWGDVPLQLTEVKTISADKLDEIYPQIFPARAPQAEVYAQIIADLETALTRVRTTAPHKGFATTGAVNAMLAKVHATQAPQDWAKVSQYCDAVINGGYSLLPNYGDLWPTANENTAESIFEINYTGGATMATGARPFSGARTGRNSTCRATTFWQHSMQRATKSARMLPSFLRMFRANGQTSITHPRTTRSSTNGATTNRAATRTISSSAWRTSCC